MCLLKNLEIKQEKILYHKETKQHVIKSKSINEKIKEEIRKYLEINENKNIVFQKLWDAMKAVLRGKYATIQAFLKKK